LKTLKYSSSDELENDSEQLEDEDNEQSSNAELEDEAKNDNEYLRNCPAHDIEAYLLNFLKKWGARDVSFKKIDKLLAGLRVIFLCQNHIKQFLIVLVLLILKKLAVA